MTRQEAMDALDLIPDMIADCTDCHEMYEALDMAIKALGQELTAEYSSDVISRQAAIETMEKESQVDGAYDYIDIKTIVDLLNDLPSADRPKWIPVSEKLPDTHDDMLVTDGENMAVGSYRDDANAWENYNFGWLENLSEPPHGIKTVIAWRPLPEQYKSRKRGMI